MSIVFKQQTSTIAKFSDEIEQAQLGQDAGWKGGRTLEIVDQKVLQPLLQRSSINTHHGKTPAVTS